MGEIGYPRNEFLYELKNWEIIAIRRGHDNRRRDLWSALRWSTWWLMHNGMVDWSEHGINSQTDLIRFPWDKKAVARDMPDDDWIEQMREKLQDANREAGK